LAEVKGIGGAVGIDPSKLTADAIASGDVDLGAEISAS